MENSLTISDSLVGSLCREMDSIRYQIKNLLNSISNSKNLTLNARLKEELFSLQQRREEVLRSTKEWEKKGDHDSLSIKFLMEISKRAINIETLY